MNQYMGLTNTYYFAIILFKTCLLRWLVHFTQRSWVNSRRKEERSSVMSSLVLLNRDGVVARKLQIVSLPSDYAIPEGMTLSWRTEIHVSSSDPVAGWRGPKEPVEAFFYLGNAQGQVCRNGFKESERDDQYRLRFASRNLTVTVQGASAKDVMELREHILHLIHSGAKWNVSNDLNPKPKKGLLQRLKKMVGITK